MQQPGRGDAWQRFLALFKLPQLLCLDEEEIPKCFFVWSRTWRNGGIVLTSVCEDCVDKKLGAILSTPIHQVIDEQAFIEKFPGGVVPCQVSRDYSGEEVVVHNHRRPP